MTACSSRLQMDFSLSPINTDQLVQTVALDAVIRHGINKVLEHGSFWDNEEAELKELIDLRHALLVPEWGKLQFMSRNFH